MALWSQILAIVAAIAVTWGLGWAVPPFAYPVGQACLLLVWGLTPWWGLIPMTSIAGMLLFSTFGIDAWPLICAMTLSGLGAMPSGVWMREGRGPMRAFIAMPFLIFGPWFIWRLFLSYSPYPTDHLPWYPSGLLSMIVIWAAVIWVREYKPKRRSYSLSDAPITWRGSR